MFIGTFIYSIVRSKRKLRTLLYTFGAMIASVCIAVLLVVLVFESKGLSSHDSGYVAGYVSGYFAEITGIVTSLIYSGKTKSLPDAAVNV